MLKNYIHFTLTNMHEQVLPHWNAPTAGNCQGQFTLTIPDSGL